MSKALLLGMVSLSLTCFAQTPGAPRLLPLSQQIAVRENWLEKRHQMILPMMRRLAISMWIESGDHRIFRRNSEAVLRVRR